MYIDSLPTTCIAVTAVAKVQKTFRSPKNSARHRHHILGTYILTTYTYIRTGPQTAPYNVHGSQNSSPAVQYNLSKMYFSPNQGLCGQRNKQRVRIHDSAASVCVCCAVPAGMPCFTESEYKCTTTTIM